MTARSTSTDEHLWGRILALHGRIEQELARALHRRHGLGLSEYRALSRLAVADHGELRIQELAEALGLNQSSVSRLATRLEEAGLTRRDVCVDDRRGIYSQITDLGRDRQAAAAPSYREVLSAALDLAATDPDLADAVAALRADQHPATRTA